MSRNMLSTKQHKIINFSLLIIFFMLWTWMLYSLNQLYNTNTQDLEIIFSKLKYLAYFLILDILILTLSMFMWFVDTQKKFKKNVLIKAEKERMLKSQQLDYENQKKLLSNMTELYNKAIETDRLKSDFFSNVSHELKTPLSVILGAIQVIENNIANESQTGKTQKHYKTIKQNCYRLLRLLNNVLDISKLDSGFLKINPVNCNIVYLVEEITQSVAIFAEQKGIKIEFDTDYEEIITAIDIDKIERIMLNLLSNSIKFTASGGNINILISCSDDNVIISIKDTGIGIPEDMQNSIFDRFKQVDNGLVKDYEGTGIGLSLVKSFVELHNGSIAVNSEINKGSEFIIKLPVKLAESIDIDNIEAEKLQNKIIDAIKIEFSDIYSAAS